MRTDRVVVARFTFLPAKAKQKHCSAPHDQAVEASAKAMSLGFPDLLKTTNLYW